MMWESLRSLTRRVHVEDLVREGMFVTRRALRRLGWLIKRRIVSSQRSIPRIYLSVAGSKRLHIGCGSQLLEGWLNSDLYPSRSDVMHLDATQPFPLPDGSFDYVFSEHMIEHVSYDQGRRMLEECHRVLKIDGIVRVSTPDLSFLTDLYLGRSGELGERYVRWAVERHVPAPRAEAVFVINHFMRSWGHAFIYDELTLTMALEAVGFTDVVRRALLESDHEALCGLENIERMPEEFLRLETMTLEATKPSG